MPVGRRVEERHDGYCHSLLKRTSIIAAAIMLAWALTPSPASAQVIERGIQGGVTGAIIGGIIGGGKGAGRGAAIGAGVGVVAGAIEADQNARARAYYGGRRPGPISSTTRSRRCCGLATIRGRPMASMASARPRPSANINTPIACR